MILFSLASVDYSGDRCERQCPYVCWGWDFHHSDRGRGIGAEFAQCISYWCRWWPQCKDFLFTWSRWWWAYRHTARLTKSSTYITLLLTGIFTIDEVTGGLSLIQTLDRETNDRYIQVYWSMSLLMVLVCSYLLRVVARDGGLEPRSSNATILVTVSDENDNDPVITNIISGITRAEVTEVCRNKLVLVK